MKTSVLVVDDELLIRKSLAKVLRGARLRGRAARAPAPRASRRSREVRPQVMILDMRLPDTDGLSVLRRVRELDPLLQVIVITAYGDVQSAVDAMKLGACDFLRKPYEMEDIVLAVESAGRHFRQATELDLYRRQAWQPLLGEEIIGAVAAHARGARPDRQGGAQPGHLGADHGRERHRQGTGRPGDPLPQRPRPGAAHGGQLLVVPGDPARERAVRPRAAAPSPTPPTPRRAWSSCATAARCSWTRSRTCRCRPRPSCCASSTTATSSGSAARRTSRSTSASWPPPTRTWTSEVRIGRFRSDLYFRLKVVSIHLPPLRERGDDVLLLARHFLREFSRKFQKRFRDIAPEAAQRCWRYRWPGNVRELQATCIERVVLLEEGDAARRRAPAARDARAAAPAPRRRAPARDARRARLPTLAQIEAEHISEVLRLTSGNKSRAARILGISRQGLIEKLRRLRLEDERATVVKYLDTRNERGQLSHPQRSGHMRHRMRHRFATLTRNEPIVDS